MSSAKWRLSCLGLNVLNHVTVVTASLNTLKRSGHRCAGIVVAGGTGSCPLVPPDLVTTVGYRRQVTAVTRLRWPTVVTAGLSLWRPIRLNDCIEISIDCIANDRCTNNPTTNVFVLLFMSDIKNPSIDVYSEYVYHLQMIGGEHITGARTAGTSVVASKVRGRENFFTF